MGPEPEEERAQEEAHILMLRVALALVDDARHGGGFETDKTRLEERVREVLMRLGSAEADSDEPPVTATPEDRDRVVLSASTGEHSTIGAVLRSDGVLLEEYSGFGVTAVAVDTSDLSPQEMNELQQAQSDWEARMSRPQFQGDHFLRVLAVDPQPDSKVQFLAVEIFSDGFVVHCTSDDDPESEEMDLRHEMSEDLDHLSGVFVEDDLGTEYYETGSTGGGVVVTHGAIAFAPAIPEAARTLRLSTSGGAVELVL